MKYFIMDVKNNLDFYLREKFCFSKKNYSESNESKDEIFRSLELIEREKFLFDKFNLSDLKSNSTKENYLLNIYTLDLLDKYLPVKSKNNLSVLDIGCKNWFYVQAEHAFFKKYSKNLNLHGIELDANRLYSNFYSRAEVAKFYMKNLSDVKYIHGDFLKYNGNYDYIIWILPFVVQEPLLKWGLPGRYFQPESMLEHAYNVLNPDGKIFIINQGEIEYEMQKTLCEKLNIKFVQIGEIKSVFYNYKPRYLTIISK